MRLLIPLLISTMFLGAQTPADTSFYGVTYVEMTPSSKAAAITAFKQYRDASRKEDGFIRFEIFEQTGWAGHLVIIESWANQKAFEAHATAAHTKDWRGKADSLRLSEYDLRPYKSLSVATGSAAPDNQAVFVISHVDIGGQGTNAGDLLRRQAEASRKEDGNLRFDVLQHAMRANHFTVIEAWRNDRALDAHAAAPHTRQYRDGIGPIIGSPLDQRVFKSVE
jgi:(4S)-4-hydroxy-5-phosphonooxypentane-2,3-dione isomerase